MNRRLRVWADAASEVRASTASSAEQRSPFINTCIDFVFIASFLLHCFSKCFSIRPGSLAATNGQAATHRMPSKKDGMSGETRSLALRGDLLQVHASWCTEHHVSDVNFL